MFDNAASLQYIKMMSLTAPSEDYTSGWVAGVSVNGTFVKNSAATWDNVFGDSSIPTDWAIETASE
jgi:hypothetical protein